MGEDPLEVNSVARSLLGTLLVFSFGLVLFETVGLLWLIALFVGGSVAWILLGKGPPGAFFDALDKLVYAGERVIVSTALVVMSVLVFCDVVWTTAHDVEGPAALRFLGGIFVLCLIGGITARRPAPVAFGRKLVDGVLAFLAVLAVGAAIYVMPNGFGFAQKVALVLILWVGMLGGSMATHQGRHIAVDAVRRVIPPKLRRGFEAASGLVTVGLLGLLTHLAIGYSRGNWQEWVETDFNAGIFESVPIPYWAATVCIPIGFGIMTLRFLDVMLHGAKETDLLTSVGGGAGDEEAA